MNVSGILFYVARAARFSLVVCAVYGICRAVFLAVRREKPDLRHEAARLLAIGYLAALTEIIALRGGMGTTRKLRLVPLDTLRRTFEAGPWQFIYNLVGNILWFVPLGMLLHRKKLLCAASIGAAVSVLLETLQWLMRTGITDIDDVIINALGTLAGAILMRELNKFRKRNV